MSGLRTLDDFQNPDGSQVEDEKEGKNQALALPTATSFIVESYNLCDSGVNLEDDSELAPDDMQAQDDGDDLGMQQPRRTGESILATIENDANRDIVREFYDERTGLSGKQNAYNALVGVVMFVRWIADKALASATGDIQRYLNARRDTPANKAAWLKQFGKRFQPVTHRAAHEANIRALFIFMQRRGLISQAPPAREHQPLPSDNLDKILAADEVQRLVAFSGPDLGGFVIAHFVGLDVGTLRTLRASNVQRLEDGTPVIKTDDGRIALTGPFAAPIEGLMFRRCKEDPRGDPFLFPSLSNPQEALTGEQHTNKLFATGRRKAISIKPLSGVRLYYTGLAYVIQCGMPLDYVHWLSNRRDPTALEQFFDAVQLANANGTLACIKPPKHGKPVGTKIACACGHHNNIGDLACPRCLANLPSHADHAFNKARHELHCIIDDLLVARGETSEDRYAAALKILAERPQRREVHR